MPNYAQKILDHDGKLAHHSPICLIKNVAIHSGDMNLTWHEQVAMVKLIEVLMAGMFHAPYRPGGTESWTEHWGQAVIELSVWEAGELPWDKGLCSHPPLTKAVVDMDCTPEQLAAKAEADKKTRKRSNDKHNRMTREGLLLVNTVEQGKRSIESFDEVEAKQYTSAVKARKQTRKHDDKD